MAKNTFFNFARLLYHVMLLLYSTAHNRSKGLMKPVCKRHVHPSQGTGCACEQPQGCPLAHVYSRKWPALWQSELSPAPPCSVQSPWWCHLETGILHRETRIIEKSSGGECGAGTGRHERWGYSEGTEREILKHSKYTQQDKLVGKHRRDKILCSRLYPCFLLFL